MESSCSSTCSSESSSQGEEEYGRKSTSFEAALLEAIRGKNLRIDADQLSIKHYRGFDAEILDVRSVKVKDSTHLEIIKATVVKSTENLFEIVQGKDGNEQTVHQNSQQILGALKPLLSKALVICDRSSDAASVEYNTMLFNSHQKHCATVRGHVDELLRHRNVPVFFMEDKAPFADLSRKDYLAQALAALKGFGEDFVEYTAHVAPRFWGIVRNESHWVFLRWGYYGGRRVLSHTEPIQVATWDAAVRAVVFNEKGLEQITKLLCNAIVDTTGLMRTVNIAMSNADLRGEESEYYESESESKGESGDMHMRTDTFNTQGASDGSGSGHDGRGNKSGDVAKGGSLGDRKRKRVSAKSAPTAKIDRLLKKRGRDLVHPQSDLTLENVAGRECYVNSLPFSKRRLAFR